MQILDEFVLLRPWWLLLLPIGAVLAYWVTRKRSDSWKRICDPELLPHLIVAGDKRSVSLTRCVVFAGWLVAVVALAGPAWDKENTQLYQSVDAMVIVFDLSRSMNSTDVLPSRLERARYKAIQIIESDHDQAVGLVAFAGNAFDVAPVSDDVATVTHLVQSLLTSVMPIQGSNASEGLFRAEQLLRNSGYGTGSVVLLTDGVDSAAFDAANDLLRNGYRLSVVGVGTKTGAPVRLEGGEFLKDRLGEFVVAPVDQDRLAELAFAGGGTLTLITSEGEDLTQPQTRFTATKLDAVDSRQASTVNWKDRGPWFLVLLIPLVALMFRRGWLLAAAWIVMAAPQESSAFDWIDLWQRSDQQAADAILSGQYDNDALFSHPEWKGIAHYRQDQFDQAVTEFSKSSDKIALYNHGNALTKMTDFQAAISQYESALEIDPDFEDAQFNLDLLRRLMEQQQKDGGQGESRDGQQGNMQDAENRDDGLEGTPPNLDQAGSQGSQKEGDSSQRSGQQSMGQEQSNEEALEDAEAGSKDNIVLQADLGEELNQVMEQWLRQIPDDPGGLLRRKFYYENELRDKVPEVTQSW